MVSVLLQFAEARLGPMPPELQPALEALAGRAAEVVLEQVMSAASWDELLNED